jgi:Arc/MetJ-type ribon-helix-helix transcriptional regulator
MTAHKHMNTQRTHIVIPEQLAADIDSLVGKRSRSAFLTQAAEKELMRLRQIKALEAAAGSWKDKDHPELKQGAAKWVRNLRREYDERFEKVNAR